MFPQNAQVNSIESPPLLDLLLSELAPGPADRARLQVAYGVACFIVGATNCELAALRERSALDGHGWFPSGSDKIADTITAIVQAIKIEAAMTISTPQRFKVMASHPPRASICTERSLVALAPA
jgi:hypothetical protein